MTHFQDLKSRLPRSLQELVDSSEGLDPAEPYVAFVADLVQLAFDNAIETGLALAALFDLAVSARYIENVGNDNWIYCKEWGIPTALYPFVNACPLCTVNGEFAHVFANKPPSAQIGHATSVTLAIMLNALARRNTGGDFEVREIRGTGVVDAILIGPDSLTLMEIKSSPLVALPVMGEVPLLTTNAQEDWKRIETPSHTRTATTGSEPLSFLVNRELAIPLGSQRSFEAGRHYRRIKQWLETKDNLDQYVRAWIEMYDSYDSKTDRPAVYWLTNGCGIPTPRPDSWPRTSSGRAFESISDSKSSVGIDRTDDIKKGIYQVLKMSTHYKEDEFDASIHIYVALVSNVHAVKHHNDYLSKVQDVIWTLDGKDRSYVIERTPELTTVLSERLYNLVDAIFSFTRPYYREQRLKEVLSLD